MVDILLAKPGQHEQVILDLFLEYLKWGTSRLDEQWGLKFSAEEMVEEHRASLDKFMPPKGRLLLAYVEDTPVGVACLKELEGTTGEVKRMYVRPEYRGRGIGKALMQKLIAEAAEIGYTCLRLDSARFMAEAHRLYSSMGFEEIQPYEGSEIPEEFRSYWLFMEKEL
jgi:GNAT superfamily N-acetyltransferase